MLKKVIINIDDVMLNKNVLFEGVPIDERWSKAIIDLYDNGFDIVLYSNLPKPSYKMITDTLMKNKIYYDYLKLGMSQEEVLQQNDVSFAINFDDDVVKTCNVLSFNNS